MRFPAMPTAFCAVVLLVAWLGLSVGPGPVVRTIRVQDAVVRIRAASALQLAPVPGSSVGFDCNNAMVWKDDRLIAFSSHEKPYRSTGRSVRDFERPAVEVAIDSLGSTLKGGVWIEAVHRDPSGLLYAWYHNEPKDLPGVPGDRTAPRIGQMVSADDGKSWRDQGILLEAPSSSHRVPTDNRYFVGGFGDFSAVPDRSGEYLYFFISQYDADPRSQGISTARLRLRDLTDPVGRVEMWRGRGWSPGQGEVPGTPIFPARSDWHARDADAFWGPSVHWNSAIRAFVIVLNRAEDSGWRQDGLYLSVTSRPDLPSTWSTPTKLIDSKEWYPQIVGLNAAAGETDRLCGDTGRLFVKGQSRWMITFEAAPAQP